MPKLEAGEPAPDFTLPAADGSTVRLSDLRGRHVVVYFYPKASTPGCTTEACDFRDNLASLQGAGYTVLGISPDRPGALSDFAKAESLPYPLLSDPDHAVLEQWGAWGEKTMYGKKVTGVIRSTVWIGPDGKVKRHWKRVAKAETHPAQVLAALQEG